jgi:hypothetical protein
MEGLQKSEAQEQHEEDQIEPQEVEGEAGGAG